jgi:hypothetical protein
MPPYGWNSRNQPSEKEIKIHAISQSNPGDGRWVRNAALISA